MARRHSCKMFMKSTQGVNVIKLLTAVSYDLKSRALVGCLDPVALALLVNIRLG
jgi:hypothetical protein